MQTIRKNLGWLTFAGIVMLVLGMVAIALPAVASLATAMFVGWLLLFGGAARVAGSLGWLHGGDAAAGVLGGLLAAVVGLFVVIDPVDGLLGLTLALGLLFFGSGAAQVIAAFALRPAEGWGLALVNGVVSIVLGLVITTGWPVSGLWVIGLLVGLELMIQGLRYIAFASAARAAMRAHGEVAVGIAAPDARPAPGARDKRTTG